MLCSYISQLHYDVYEAGNGLEGIKLAQALKPDLIILDLMMPVASGDLTLGFVRSTRGLEKTPVIVVSAHPNADRIAEQLHANACLKKPFRLRELAALLQELAPVPL
jgi:DNA-binding response OmpR family regulator